MLKTCILQVLISSQVLFSTVDGTDLIHPLPPLSLAKIYNLVPTSNPLASQRFHPIKTDIHWDLASGSKKGGNQVSPKRAKNFEFVSDMNLLTSDYWKNAMILAIGEKKLMQNVRANIMEIDSSCLKSLSKRATDAGKHKLCSDMENFVSRLEVYLRSDTPPDDPFLKSQALIYKELQKTNIKHSRIMSLLYHSNNLLAEVKEFNIHPKFLANAVLTEVYGTDGRSVMFWNSLGAWQQVVKYDDGKHNIHQSLMKFPEAARALENFLNRFFPDNINGKPYKNFEQDLKQYTELDKISHGVIPTLMYRNTFGELPLARVTVKFFKDGTLKTNFEVYQTSSQETPEEKESRSQGPLPDAKSSNPAVTEAKTSSSNTTPKKTKFIPQSNNAIVVNEFVNQAPLVQAVETRDENGFVKRLKLALYNHRTTILDITEFTFDMGLHHLISSYADSAHIDSFDIEDTFFNDFKGYMTGAGAKHREHKSDVEQKSAKPSAKQYENLHANSYDEPDHNVHETIFERLMEVNEGKIDSVDAIMNLAEDIFHGGVQDVSDVVDQVENYFGHHSTTDNLGHFFMSHPEFSSIRDIVSAANTHVSHHPSFHPGESFARVLVGILWDNYRSLPVTKQIVIGAACACLVPLIPKATVIFVGKTITYRAASQLGLSLLPKDMASCVSFIIPYLSILAGDPSHMFASAAETYFSIQFASQSRKFVYFLLKNLLPAVPNANPQIENRMGNAKATKEKEEPCRAHNCREATLYVSPVGEIHDYYKFSGTTPKTVEQILNEQRKAAGYQAAYRSFNKFKL